MADSWGRCVLAISGSLIVGCVSVDELQTPYADLERGAAGASGAGGKGADELTPGQQGACGVDGWQFLRLGGREQGQDWAQPSLVPGCSGASHRLSALAPRLGAKLEITLAAGTGRIIDATYSTTSRGADGEDWGAYEAFVELDSLSFATTAAQAAEQPFDLAGTIWGPLGPVTLAAGGCARVRLQPC